VIFSLVASVSFAQASIHVVGANETEIIIEVRGYGDTSYGVEYALAGNTTYVGDTSSPRFTISGLLSNREYVITVYTSAGTLSVSARTAAEEATVVSKPRVITCPFLPPGLFAIGYGEYTQCKRVGAAGVANPALMAQGILDALDVFGVVDAEMRVCFGQHGRLKFLDSTTIPRTESDLAAEYIDGLICGRIDRIGTVVLLRAGETAGVATDLAPVSVETGGIASTGCRLVSTDYVSLRSGPSVNYARLDIIPRGTRLTARARSSDWFIVDYKTLRGWVIGDYMTASTGCDAIQEGNAVFLLPQKSPLPPQAIAPEAPAEVESEAVAAPALPGVTIVDCQLRTGDIINLRLAPGLDQEIFAEIPFQAQLTAIKKWGDWFEVEFEGESGWVNIDYVFRRSGICS
jgi:uncharacterized protein YraI